MALIASLISAVYVSVSALLLYWCVRALLWYRKIAIAGAELEKLPGDKRHWLFGHLLQHPGANEEGLQWAIDCGRRSGNRVFKVWFGPFRPVAFFFHPDTLKLILKTTEPKASGGNGGYSMVRPWLGDGLLLSSGQKWHRNRKLLTPAFHFDILRPYQQIYNEAAEILMGKWTKQMETSSGKSIEIFTSVSQCTLDVILRCAFSYTGDVQRTGEKDPYVTKVMAMAEMVVKRSFTIPWYVDWIYYKTSHGKAFAENCAYMHEVADGVIKQRKKTLAENENSVQSRRLDFLDILLTAKDENGCGLTDLEIRNEVDTFLFEGHDTTASAISWCLYHLAKHTDCQKKARNEVDDLLSDRESPFITWDDLSEMPYLTMCIKESLRRVPPVPVVLRELTAPMEVDGVTLMPGTIINIHVFLLHHNESVWGADHMDYKPERFNPENTRKMDSHAFLPFAAGPRNCIGQVFAMHEIKVIVAKILHRFLLEVDETNPVEMRPVLTMRAKNGIKLIFTSRK